MKHKIALYETAHTYKKEAIPHPEDRPNKFTYDILQISK